MVTRAQSASLAELVRKLQTYREEAGLSQSDIYAVHTSVSRLESGKTSLSEKWVARYERALGRDDLLGQFRDIMDAPRTPRPKLPEVDDFASRTRLLESRMVVTLGEVVTIQDRRLILPLHPPLAAARLRNSIPAVNGRRPRLLDRYAVGATVTGHSWPQPNMLVIDLVFDPPLSQVVMPYTVDMVYRWDSIAPFITETVGAPSDYFEVRVQFPSLHYEVVSCEGLPEAVAAAEVEAFRSGGSHRLVTKRLTVSNTVTVVHRHLRPAFLYGVFWRPTGGPPVS